MRRAPNCGLADGGKGYAGRDNAAKAGDEVEELYVCSVARMKGSSLS